MLFLICFFRHSIIPISVDYQYVTSNQQDFKKKIMLLRVSLRLGFDIFSEGVLSERKARKLLRLMKAYRHLMKIYDVCSYRACATSAMRDAKNGSEIIKEISKETGINIEIIGGSEEARIIYSNHLECMADRHGAYLYVDVGGGSTEINFLKEGELLSSVSYNIGTVRLLTGQADQHHWFGWKYQQNLSHGFCKKCVEAEYASIVCARSIQSAQHFKRGRANESVCLEARSC